MLNRKLVVALLNGTNYTAMETGNGNDCFEIVRLGIPRIDLLLLDISMQGLNGIEVCRAIRESDNEHLQKMPVIAYTARAMEEDCREYLANGFTDVLIKPIVKSDLIKLLDKYLS